jgi:hypothetical protein
VPLPVFLLQLFSLPVSEISLAVVGFEKQGYPDSSLGSRLFGRAIASEVNKTLRPPALSRFFLRLMFDGP